VPEEAFPSRQVWEVGSPPSDADYVDLIEWVAGVAQFASVVIFPRDEVTRTSRDVLSAFEQAGSEVVRSDSWPGTDTLGTEFVDRYVAHLTPELLSVIRTVARRLRDWRAPDLPADLHFLRHDGSVVLGNVAAHNQLWLDIDQSEMASIPGGLAAVLQLAEPSRFFDNHTDPVWGSSSDVIVVAASDYGPGTLERLVCRTVGDDLFEVCCIPFQVRDLALGDEITARRQGDGSLTMAAITRRSGHAVDLVRLIEPSFGLNNLVSEMREVGALVEVAGRNWIAVDRVPHDEPVESQLDELLARSVVEVW
jgi:hypothetical protein